MALPATSVFACSSLLNKSIGYRECLPRGKAGAFGEMKTFIDPNLLQRLRVGPLAPYLDAYLKRIEQEGFLPSSAPMHMYAIARFSNKSHFPSYKGCAAVNDGTQARVH